MKKTLANVKCNTQNKRRKTTWKSASFSKFQKYKANTRAQDGKNVEIVRVEIDLRKQVIAHDLSRGKAGDIESRGTHLKFPRTCALSIDGLQTELSFG